MALVEPGRCATTFVRDAFAVDRLGAEVVGVHREAAAGRAAEPFELAGDVPAPAPRSPAAARAPLREARGQALQFGERGRAFERVGRERRGERQRAGAQREGGDREREQERHEGRAVQAPVEHRA